MSQKAEEAVRVMIEEKKTFPTFSEDIYGKVRRRDLVRVTKEMYKLEPKIFYKLKPVQEKSLLGFLNLLLNSEERENILTIIEQWKFIAVCKEVDEDIIHFMIWWKTLIVSIVV